MITRRDVLKRGVVGGVTAAAGLQRVVFGGEPADEPKTQTSGQIFFHAKLAVGTQEFEGAFSIDPEASTWRLVDGDATRSARVSPDGKLLAYSERRRPEGNLQPGLWISPVAGGPAKRISELTGAPYWSPDGQQLIVSGAPRDEDPASFETWRLNADGSEAERLSIPEPDLVLDWSPDGAWLLVSSSREKPNDSPFGFVNRPVYAVRPDGSERHLVTPARDIVCWRHRFTADSKHVIYFQIDGEDDNRLYITDVAGKQTKPFRTEVDELAPFTAIGAPDGEHLAIMRFPCKRNPDGKKADTLRNCRLEISTMEGKTSRYLNLPPAEVLWLIDWRAGKTA